MEDLKTTNKLLLVIVLPLLFYLLHILDFIFIPLVASLFIALLFLPLMRWLAERKIANWLSVLVVILILAGIIQISIVLLKLTLKEIVSVDADFIELAKDKIRLLVQQVAAFIGLEAPSEIGLKDIFKIDGLGKNIPQTVLSLGHVLSMSLTTLFFLVLWLSGSMNFQKLFTTLVLKKEYASIKAFRKIEKDLILFMKVKFLMSFLTGVGTGLFCYAFDVSFPLFWGLFGFLINFVQMIGSFVTVIACSIFALVELDPTSTLFFFILCITLVQVLFGAILEPILMGKSFSINVIAILIMLMFWGFIWGIPGLIMSIPITVFIKIVLDQFPSTKKIASIIEGKS